MVNETAPISENIIEDDAATAFVVDEVVEVEDSVEEAEDNSEVETLVEYATKDELNSYKLKLKDSSQKMK